MQTSKKFMKTSLNNIYKSFIRLYLDLFLLIGIHSMQNWPATTRYEVARKEAQKD